MLALHISTVDMIIFGVGNPAPLYVGSMLCVCGGGGGYVSTGPLKERKQQQKMRSVNGTFTTVVQYVHT